LLLDAFAERLRDAKPAADEDVVFTAHSLPSRVVEAGDPYPTEVAATAAGVAARAGVARYHVAYQSAGRTPEPWIGPDVGALISEQAARGVRRFLVAPIGFVCDHTEICSISTCRRKRPRRYRTRPCAARIAQHAADIHRHARRSRQTAVMITESDNQVIG
jgi:hypothetical protein